MNTLVGTSLQADTRIKHVIIENTYQIYCLLCRYKRGETLGYNASEDVLWFSPLDQYALHCHNHASPTVGATLTIVWRMVAGSFTEKHMP
jgi:hypothetical protein